MSKKETKRVPYQCEKLDGIATLSLTYTIVTEDYKVISKFHCNNCSDCGVQKKSQGLGFEYDWNSCPAYVEANKK